MKFNNKIKRELISEIGLFIIGISLAVLFFRNNILLAFLLIITALIGLKIWHGKNDIYFFVTAAILGPILEIICIYFGIWRYANPSFLGIPIWLPFVWGLSVLLIERISGTFIKILK